MARVFLPQQVQGLAEGTESLDLAVEDYRGLMKELERRFPGIREALEQDMAVVIDGDIINDPLLERVEPDSEVHFITRISGG